MSNDGIEEGVPIHAGEYILPATSLTRKMLDDAIEEMLKPPVYTICVGSNRHVIHPAEHARIANGEHVVTFCANCFAPLEFNKEDT